ncbi:MAG: hypothetical protein ACI90V_002408, partial [Bacillariaceae sp.]
PLQLRKTTSTIAIPIFWIVYSISILIKNILQNTTKVRIPCMTENSKKEEEYD